MADYITDKAWEETYVPQVVAIFQTLLHYLTDISVADKVKDRKYATDFEVKMQGRPISVRLRRAKYDFRDFTIRSRRDNGFETELSKLKRGLGSVFFYGWTTKDHKILEWVLIDLCKVRASGLLDRKWDETPNKDANGNPDGTYFIAIPIRDLYAAGCLIAWDVSEKALLPLRSHIPRVRVHVNKKPGQDIYVSLWEEVPA